MTPMLVQRPRADRAFERVYRQNVRHVYGYALAVLRCPEDAEDVTQATFLNAYRAYERGVFPRSPDNWLISIVHGLCEQRARQESRLGAVAYEDQADEAVPEDEEPSPNDVRRALGRLPFDQRAALMMREVEGRSYAELVETLGVSSAEVESLLFRARRALREELDESSLTCHQAERAISRRLDGLLDRAERKQLRSHLRECVDCARFARNQRTQRTALRALVNVPLPGLTRVVLRKIKRISGQSVGFRRPPASPSARVIRACSSSFGSNHPLSTGRRSGGGVLLCVRGIPVGYPRPMGVLNKRNAVLGWAVWTVSKGAAKRKAKSAAPGRSDGSMRPNKSAIAAALATAGGALWFWRRRSGGSDES